MLETIVKAPFIRLFFGLAIGIILRFTFVIPQTIILSVLFITFLLAIGLGTLNNISGKYKYRWIYGINLSLLLLFLGAFITDQKLAYETLNSNLGSRPCEMVGTITVPPECRTKSVRCYLKIEQIKEKDGYTISSEKILVYFHKDARSVQLRTGDMVLLKTIPSEVDQSGNPFEFNFKKYLANNGIRFTAYVDSGSWKYLSHKKLLFYVQWADDLRIKLLSKFSELGMTGDELAVASSLTIGDQSGLDDEIKHAYVTSGTMHVLAVSGMHVALIYELLIIILSFFDRIKNGKIVKLLLILVIIWMYSLITGLPASVLRASTMFTFIILGQLTQRPANIFNSLACSAFFLLLINPANLLDVGFQLSYLAVLSIIIFYPLIYKSIYVKSWLLNQLWSIIAVTLAAQIGTTPISLYYFHQFPNLFMISNLIIIPLSTLIIYFAIILLVFSGWSLIAIFLGKIFNFLVWLLNKSVLMIEKIPHAITPGIYLNEFQVMMLYLFAIVATYFVLRKRPVYLIACLCIIVGLAFFHLMNDLTLLQTKEVIVYNERENTVIQFRNGTHSTWLMDHRTEMATRFIERARYGMKCNENIVMIMDSAFFQNSKDGIWLNHMCWIRGNLIQFDNKRFILCTETKSIQTSNFKLPVDYLIYTNVSNDCKKLKSWDQYLSKRIVLSSTISKFRSVIFEKQLHNQSQFVYNVSTMGALRIRL